MSVSERLHLDLAAGARGDMIAGALVAVGADVRSAQRALDDVGLAFVSLVVEPARRAGLIATRVRFVVDGAELAAPLVDAPHVLHARRGRHSIARPRLHPAERSTHGAVKIASGVVDTGDLRGAGLVAGPADSASQRTQSRARRVAKARAKHSAFEQWLDATVRASDVVDALRAAELPTVTKALALRAARRAVDALIVVAGTGARLRGASALRALCEIIAGAALVDGLSPAAITSSPLGLSRVAREDEGIALGAGGDEPRWPVPSPWLLEVLAGVPVVERDDGAACSDVTGAALAWACVHRFGARGVTSSLRQGLGAGSVDAPGSALVARALLGPSAPVRSRPAERAVETMCDLVGVLPVDVDVPVLWRALLAAGARPAAVREASRVDDDGVMRRALEVQAGVASGDVEEASALLWRAGAVDVKCAWVEVRSAAVANVTVPIGRGRTKAGVRVRVWRVGSVGSAPVRVEPDDGDVKAAAAKQRRSEHAVAADAVAAWERLDRDRRGEGDGDE